jgi:FAD/FMN-containing dehydrogenase
MPCTGDGSFGAVLRFNILRNWARTRVLTPPNVLVPNSVAQIAAAVRAVDTGGGVLRAVGSNWSYTQVALTPEVTHVVDLSALSSILNGTNPESADTLLPFALTDEARANAANLIHVEAGIKIHALNCTLDARGKAMSTLGGSNGQSLAGVLGTATHGSDIDLAPIADQVRAVHLVGPGGQEWWIEPAEGTGNVTLRARLEAARDAGRLCSDIRIEYDTALFDAVLVSAGRMGVIYAVVVEIRDAFRLREDRERTTWTAARTRIQREIIDGLPPVTGTRPCFMEIVVSPYAGGDGQRLAIISTRRETTEPSNERPPAPDIFGLVCNLQPLRPVLLGLAGLIPALIAAAAATALAAISWLLAIPFIGGILFAAASTGVIAAATTGLIALETAIVAALSVPGENIAQKLATVVNLATAVGQKGIVRDLINAVVLFQRDPNAAPIINRSFRVSTSQPACPAWSESPNCMREIDGMEFALPVTPGTSALFDFMNDVFALTTEFFNANRPPGFALSIRFTRGTRASIGMQQFARTASVEFIMLRGFVGHEDFKRRVYAIARSRGAIPHWGLIHEIDAAEVERRYGSRLTSWRFQLLRLIDAGGGRTATFRTSFSISRGLEPPVGCVLPRALVDIGRRILMGLARSRGMRMAKEP